MYFWVVSTVTATEIRVFFFFLFENQLDNQPGKKMTYILMILIV